MTKTAIITGVCGQDGSLLAEKLLDKGYHVTGVQRYSSREGFGCLTPEIQARIEYIVGDICDPGFVNILFETPVDLFINCAASSHVKYSFDNPVTVLNNTGLAVTNILEAIRNYQPDCHFVQLSSSEMYGGTPENGIITEETPFCPRSPYACAKVLAHDMTKLYRNAYGLHASNSIAFNHEQPGRRGKEFVTRKIAIQVAEVKAGIRPSVQLGNMLARRDWGLASEYCDGMIMIGEAQTPGDYILATGETHSVADFLVEAMKVAFGEFIPKYVHQTEDASAIRPLEVHTLLGSYNKINNILGWEPKTKFKELVRLMVEWELDALGVDPLVGHTTDGLAILGKANE